MLHAVATWWDGVELWLTQLDFTVQVVLVVAVVGPVCWWAAAIIDTVVERSVAARLEAAERREWRRSGAAPSIDTSTGTHTDAITDASTDTDAGAPTGA